jgi:hypothetical protein
MPGRRPGISDKDQRRGGDDGLNAQAIISNILFLRTSHTVDGEQVILSLATL